MRLAIVERLMQVYWPIWMANYYARHDPWKSKPREFLHDDQRFRSRGRGYDCGRVRYFLDLLARGEMFDPISVDCRWHGHFPGTPEVIDGHHRYVAAVIIGVEEIPISFGGVARVGDWLCGKIQSPPPETGLSTENRLYALEFEGAQLASVEAWE